MVKTFFFLGKGYRKYERRKNNASYLYLVSLYDNIKCKDILRLSGAQSQKTDKQVKQIMVM